MNDPIRLRADLFTHSRLPFPAIGLSQAIDQPRLRTDEVEQLRRLHVDHLNVEVDFRRADWSEWLTVGLGEARRLEVPLWLSIRLTDRYAAEWDQWQQAAQWLGIRAQAVTITGSVECIPGPVLHQVIVASCRQLFPDARLGIGLSAQAVGAVAVDAGLFDYGRLDLPDNETAWGHLAEQVNAFRAHLAGKPVYGHLVGEESRPSPVRTDETDVNQQELIMAGELLTHVLAMGRAGMEAITCLTTRGDRGVLPGTDPAVSLDADQGLFAIVSTRIRPAGLLIAALTGWQGADCRLISTSQPDTVQAFLLRKETMALLLVLNLSSQPQLVELPDILSSVNEGWSLDLETATLAMPAGELPPATPLTNRTNTLNPYAIAGFYGTCLPD